MEIRKKNNRIPNIFLTYSIPMSLVGLWPLAENTLFRKVQIIFCVLQTLLSGSGVILYILKTCNNLDAFMDSIIIVAFAIMVSTKIHCLNISKEKFALVLKAAYADWSTTENKEDRKLMKSQLQGFSITAIFFYSTSIPCLSLYIIRPFILGISAYSENVGNETITIIPCNYIYPSDYIFDRTNELIYRGMLFNQIVQITVLSSINFGTDLMYIAIMTHLCGQIEVLIRHMKELGKSSTSNQYLDNIIQRHQQLMSLTQILEDTFNKIIFIQMLLSMFFICIGGMTILLSLEGGDTMILMKNLMIVQFVLIQSYLYTYPADNLANLGEKMLRGIYNNYWYDMPNRLTKNLVFMMMRLNVPPCVTVGKFFYLTRISYTTVIKTGASYLSVLRVFIQR